MSGTLSQYEKNGTLWLSVCCNWRMAHLVCITQVKPVSCEDLVSYMNFSGYSELLHSFGSGL